MTRAIDVDRVKREIRKNKEKIVISCKQKYVPLSLIYEILNKAPTLTPPNEPLTLENLENMEDTTPVWWDQINSWVLVYKGNLTTWSGKHLYAKGSNGKFYRRPPEGEDEYE